MTEQVLNEAFEIKWKRYLENHKLPNDAWVKELAREFFMRKVDETLSNKICNDEETTYYNLPCNMYKEKDIKHSIQKIKGDFVKGKQYNWVEIENIIDKEVGPKLK